MTSRTPTEGNRVGAKRYRLREPRYCTSLSGMVDTIADIFHEVIPPADHPRLTLDSIRYDELELLREKYPERLRKLRTLVAYLSASEHAYDALYSMRYSKYPFSDESVCIRHDYRELIAQHPYSGQEIIKIHRSLTDEHRVQPDTNGVIPTMEAHLQAQSHFSKNVEHQWTEPERRIISYESLRTYLEAVQKHAEHVDSLLKYREERGIILTNGHDPFDLEDFENYLSQSALADGWI